MFSLETGSLSFHSLILSISIFPKSFGFSFLIIFLKSETSLSLPRVTLKGVLIFSDKTKKCDRCTRNHDRHFVRLFVLQRINEEEIFFFAKLKLENLYVCHVIYIELSYGVICQLSVINKIKRKKGLRIRNCNKKKRKK
jgi:hypothetical protein